MVGKIREFSQFVSDTLVNASTLAETVQGLRQELDETKSSFDSRIQHMQSELDSLRNINSQLEDSIQHVRQERDAHQAEVGQLRQEVAQVTAERDHATQLVASLQSDVESLRGQLEDHRRKLETAQYEAMHWEEEHNKARASLESVHKALGLPTRDENGKFAPFPKAVGEGNW